MTTKEALNELIYSVGFLFDEIEQHEEFAEEEQGEYQIERYEKNKKELEAWLIIFSALEPEIKTLDDLKARVESVEEEAGYTGEPDPSELETKFYEILNVWYKEELKKLPEGYGTQFEGLTKEEQKELARIYMKDGEKRVVIDDDPANCDEPCEDDVFYFYPWRGRIQVVYNNYADCDFYSFPEEFQEKAYELVKKHLEEGGE